MSAPIVLLHGFTGSPSSFDEVIERMRPGTPVLRPALSGHDGAPSAVRTFEGEADRVAALVRSEGFAGAHLVGYSLGGRIALAMLVRHPEIAIRATLIGAGPGIEGERERESRREIDEARAVLLESEGIEAFVAAWEREPIFATQAALPDGTRAAHRARRLAHSPAGLAASLRVCGQGAAPSLWNSIATIAIPVTLVVGSEDTKLLAVARRMAETMRHARVVIVGGAGHDVVVERPTDVAGLITEPES